MAPSAAVSGAIPQLASVLCEDLAVGVVAVDDEDPRAGEVVAEQVGLDARRQARRGG